jgi:hypothetical protein
MFEFLKKHKLPVALLGVFLIVAVPVMSAFYDTTFTNALQKGFIDVVELANVPDAPDTATGRFYAYSDGLYWQSDAGVKTNLITQGTGNTLDQSYDEGGAGSGRSITVDQGAVLLTGSHASNNTFEINKTTGTGNAIDITNAGTGYDIDGTGTTWYVTKTGTAVFASVSVTSWDLSATVLPGASPLIFEGATADAFETTFAITDPTADRTVTFPNMTGAVMITALTTNAADAANAVTGVSNGLLFEGATADGFESTLSPTDPTADRTILLPDQAGTILVSTAAQDAANSIKGINSGLEFEGSGADAFETQLTVTNPTADRSVVIPDQGGTVIILSNAGTQDETIVMEGNTDDAFETTLSITDPTADRTVTFPDAGGTVMLSSLATNAVDIANAVTGASNGVLFEGATADASETTLSPTDPTGDRTVTLPDASGEVLLSTAVQDAANSIKGVNNGLEFEGATADAFEVTVAVADATADSTVTIPADRTGNVELDDKTVTNDADGKTVAAAEADSINTNAGAVGGGIWNLPEASTVIGKIFMFAVAAGQNMDINPDDADQILQITNAVGDAIRQATAGSTITLVAIDATNWVVLANYGTWADVN